MAKNTDNKRIPVKHIRDRAKAAYEKQPNCFICKGEHDLELHHTHSITLLLDKWVAEKGYDISTDEGILAVRDEFIEDHKHELYSAVYTLCNRHHVLLHQVYGKSPPLNSAPKQENWLAIQREKHETGNTKVFGDSVKTGRGLFSEFY